MLETIDQITTSLVGNWMRAGHWAERTAGKTSLRGKTPASDDTLP